MAKALKAKKIQPHLEDERKERRVAIRLQKRACSHYKKTFEDLTEEEHECLLKCLAIKMGMVKPS